jgi:hypothetical protein
MENIDHFLAVVDKFHLTRFLESCHNGKLDDVQYMYKNYHYLSKDDIENGMFHAVDGGHLNVLGFLISYCFEPPKTMNHLIVYSAKEGKLDIFEFLHKNGGDIHCNKDVAFIEASRSGHLSVVKYIRENGTSIPATVNNKALQKAAKYNRLEVIKYLLVNEANIESKNHEVVKISAAHSFMEQLEYLLEQGGSKEIAEKYGSPKVQAWLLDQELSLENKKKVKQNKL